MGNITDVPGIKVGHSTDTNSYTGCTVIICENGAVGGVEVRGMASSTRQIDSLTNIHIVNKIHAVLITGGSAFGLDSAGGVMQYLEERNIGFDVRVTKVPVVAAAVIFDLSFGDFRKRPDFSMGYAACLNARKGDIEEGSFGAGTGASVGKLFGIERATKGGVGTSSVRFSDITVGALAVVNAFGDVIDPLKGTIIAGARSPDGRTFVDTRAQMKMGVSRRNFIADSTTVAVIATDAMLTREEACRVARVAHNAFAKCISPVHTSFDGDTVFVLSTGEKKADINLISILAEDVLMDAVIRGVKNANGFGILPSYSDLFREE
ncbi:MAG: P1 family peptidase [Candidatus Aenigmatarchaeota archaeon]